MPPVRPAPLHTVLGRSTKPILEGYLRAANLETGGTKAQLIDRLIAAPEAIPEEVRALAAPVRPPSPPRQGVDPATLAAVTAAVQVAMAPYGGMLADLQAQVQALEHRAGNKDTGEDDGFTIHEIVPPPPFPAAAASLYPSTFTGRSLHRSVPAGVLDSVLEGKFEVKDLWKLDPTRAHEALLASKTSQPDVAQRLHQTLFPDAEAIQTEIKGKYQTVSSLVRPWIVFTQIRELAQPGCGVYLIHYALHLLSLHNQWPDSFQAVLNYHLKVASERVNMGADLPLEEWLRTDQEAMASHFMPHAMKAARASVKSQPASSSGVPVWSASAPGSLTSRQGCHNYNDGRPCKKWPCQFRHSCRTCQVDGHPASLCPTSRTTKA
jgi:hypothetical protein